MPPRSRPTGGPSSNSSSTSSASEREYRKERYGRRKVCIFCVDKIKYVDYKDINRLRRYLSDRAKIEPRRKSGVCAKHQRKLTTALKRARHMALLPFAPQHMRG
jgi:small subunit ribosomal protein S18